jgi:hypothetical protein
VPNWREFRFSIQGEIDGVEITPLTIPFARLTEYLTDLVLLMGHKESLRLVGVAGGIAAPVIYVDSEQESRVTHQVQSAARGMAPREANAAYKRLDDRLREDNAVGRILNVSGNAQILDFPGKNLDLPQEYGPLKERASIVGQLMRIGGFDETVPIHLKRADDTIFYCEANKLVAQQLGPLIFKNIRVNGVATYSRGKEGAWKLDRFKIQSYDPEPLNQDSFSVTMEKLRAIPGSEWNEISDPLEELRKQREGEGDTTQ